MVLHVVSSSNLIPLSSCCVKIPHDDDRQKFYSVFCEGHAYVSLDGFCTEKYLRERV